MYCQLGVTVHVLSAHVWTVHVLSAYGWTVHVLSAYVLVNTEDSLCNKGTTLRFSFDLTFKMFQYLHIP